MRRTLLLVLALAMAGCGAPDDAGSEPTTTTPPAETTPTAPPAGPTPEEPTEPTQPTRPTAPPPVEVYNRTRDFQTEPAPQPEADPFDVPEGHAVLHVVIRISTSAPIDVGNSVNVRIRVLDPDGAETASCGAVGDCEQTVEKPSGGTWAVEYSGAGTVRADVRIEAR